MIVVEGPDGAGKSTLVEAITAEFDLSVGSRGTTNRDLLYTVTLPDTMRALACAVQGHRKPYVWDRLYFSDFIYAPMADRPIAFNPAQQAHIEAVMRMLTCPIILCIPPFETVLRNAAKGHQMEGVTENLRTIYEGYENMRYTMGSTADTDWPPMFEYDYTKQGVDEPLRFIAAYLETREERSL